MSPIPTTRTVSPYFSSKTAVAPVFIASAKGQDLGLDGTVRPDHPVGLVLDPRQFLLVDPGEMGEVEPEPLGVHQRAGLLDMLPENRLQSGLEEVGPGVVGLRRPAGLVEHLQSDGIPLPELPLCEPADMGDEIVQGPLRIRHIEEGAVAARDDADVADLAADLPVEGGPATITSASSPSPISSTACPSFRRAVTCDITGLPSYPYPTNSVAIPSTERRW